MGFEVEYTRENPNFAFLSLDHNQIMIQEIDPDEKDEYITGEFEYPANITPPSLFRIVHFNLSP